MDSLGKKVVETAESQTADLKGKFSKLEVFKNTGNAPIEGHWESGGHGKSDSKVPTGYNSLTGNAESTPYPVTGGSKDLRESIPARRGKKMKD